MEDAIKKMKRTLRNYILETNYEEMDEDARIEKFWQDLGDNFFSDEAIDEFLVNKSARELHKEAVLMRLREAREKRKKEREEIGEEAFNEKYPPLTLEEKRDKIRKTIKKFKLQKLSRKE